METMEKQYIISGFKQVVERIDALDTKLSGRIDKLDGRFDKLENTILRAIKVLEEKMDEIRDGVA